MKRATVVIGALWGDEGKALVTDFYAAQMANCVVIRYNGGAQAGHTVITPEHDRHVFSHFGAGTFTGAATYLSKYFVVNPILFEKERADLVRYVTSPRVIIAKTAPITTPLDMMINHVTEQARGADKHGSCGVGVWETIVRDREFHIKLNLAHLHYVRRENYLRYMLRLMRREWVPKRLAALGVAMTPAIESFFETNHYLVEGWIADTLSMCDKVEITLDETPSALPFDNVIFEGAQGLLLDMDYGTMPYVTASNTGLKNVVELASTMGIQQLNITYVTRCYATRHGAGPLAHEARNLVLPRSITHNPDETNVTNDYQGVFRYAFLDIDILSQAIAADLLYLNDSILCSNVQLAVTCLDQVKDKKLGGQMFGGHTYVTDGMTRAGREEDLLQELARKTNISSLLTSHGPTRDDVTAYAVARREECQTA